MKTILLSTLLGMALIACADEGKDKPKAEAKPYPLETCVVSGEKLGSMGKPVVVMHEGKEIRLCCKSCIKEFKADPAKFAAMVK
ncbi:MAG: hypothetical protein KDK97_12725 [Verrucomicrobiales bacterium]|nr:hypothetical protein [Verrucomicrobiales bacterium]MCP5560254.1 hypothetical protein [Verrucomicrobiaceae bacterium]